MKTSTKLFCTTALIILGCFGGLRSQTMTGTIITQPCNNNGNLGVTVTGLSLPIKYTYYQNTGTLVVVHNNVNSFTDNLTGVAAYQAIWGNPNAWGVAATDGTNTAFGNFAFTPPFTDSVKVIPAACPAQCTLQATGFVGGTPPFNCVWLNTNTSMSYSANPAAVPNGQYQITITDGAGCKVTSINSGSFNLNVQNTSGITVTITGAAANCTNGTATVSAVGGSSPYTFLWSNSATTPTLAGLSQGALTCTVTDNIGCQKSAYHYVSQVVNINFNTTITNATCLQANGAVMSFVNGGTAPYSYLWSNMATTANISSLTAGSYIVQITDAVGCTRTGYAYVNSTTPIILTNSITPTSCTAPTGGATLAATGGAAPYTGVWYTFPSNTIGMSISGRPAGNYSFKVTDANGCIQTGAANIPLNTNMSGQVYGGAVLCPQTTGTLTALASGGVSPYTYTWSTSANTQSISAAINVGYSVIMKDAVGCVLTKYGSIMQYNNMNVGIISVPVNCIYNSNGVLTAHATNGTAPYSYLWSNSATGNNINSLPMGNYYVTVTDANGCKKTAQAVVGNSGNNNTCYCTITGTVFTDSNNNCTQNSGEPGVNNIQIHCSGIGYAYTNANGVYSFQVPSGSYTITETIHQLHPLASCQSNNQVVNAVTGANCTHIVNFANNLVPLSDLHIITCDWNMPVPGNVYTQRVILQNEGTLTEGSIKIGYKHDGQLSYNSSSSWPLVRLNAITYPNWYSVMTGFAPMSAGTSTSTNISYNVATNIPLATNVFFLDTAAKSAPIATSWLTDNTPWNNVDQHSTSVVGSFDPNFKEVSPKGVGPQGNITTNDTAFTYVVHFQNTGSYFAQNIVVVDSLDSDFRLSSLRPGYSDHNYTVTMNENGVASFKFPNINLPWQSQYGDNLSSGMFTYSIKLKKGLPLGTKIRNKAAIYFDYNEPVITNETVNTIASNGTVTVAEISQLRADEILLYPNPANTHVTLVVMGNETSAGTLSIYDISGREISAREIRLQAGENYLHEDTGELQSGIYFVQLKSGNIVSGKKLVIAR